MLKQTTVEKNDKKSALKIKNKLKNIIALISKSVFFGFKLESQKEFLEFAEKKKILISRM